MVDWNAAQHNEKLVWDWFSGTTEKILFQLADASEMNEFLSGHEVSYKRAVEIGIGPLGIGWISLYGRGAPGDLIGLDPLDQLQAHTELSELNDFTVALQRRITFMNTRAEDLDLPSHEFGLVYCDNVIDHTEDPTAILKQCRNLVSPDGFLAFGVDVYSYLGYAKWTGFTRRRSSQSPNAIMHPHSFTRPSARRLLHATGWNIRAEQKVSLLRPLVGRAWRYRSLATPRES